MKQPELGQKILELRKQKGYTQEELVEQCNISVRTIQRIEAGEVTPRIFTVKTILEVLDYPLEKLHPSPTEKKIKELLLLKIDDSKQASFLNKQFKYAWIAGIVFFIIGFIEIFSDFTRFFENEMLLPTPIYVLVKLVSLAAFLFFIRGFVLMGSVLNNYFLKIVAFIFIAINCSFYMYDFASLIFDISYGYEAILMGQSITIGVVGILFGIAVIRLTKALGNIAMVTGIFEIISYALFTTVFLAIGGFVLLIPTLILEIILLYKAMKLIEQKQQELEA